ncbi:MAG: FmdB family zinc ribbon protein [bacterium]|jgi:putative FmdB family regulatory protein
MPLYEYKCGHCGELFEALQRFSDEPLTVHPKCGHGPVERLLSPPALQFKGTGWYVTDYGKGNGRSGDVKEHAKTESSQNGTSKAKTESKPASATS